MDETAEHRLEERLEKGLEVLREHLVRIEEKLDARHEKLEERVRTLENRVAQVWIVGALSTFLIAPLLSIFLHRVVQ